MAQTLLKILRQASPATLKIKNRFIERSMKTWFLLKWRYWFKTTISVQWPYGWAPINGDPNTSVESADPNDWYRWWLEKHVGRQGWSWDWQYKLGSTMIVPGYEHLYNDKLEIGFRKPKHASMFLLKWGGHK